MTWSRRSIVWLLEVAIGFGGCGPAGTSSSGDASQPVDLASNVDLAARPDGAQSDLYNNVSVCLGPCRDLAVVQDFAAPPDLATPDLTPAGFTTLSILAGQPGGFGNADRVGTAARLNRPMGITRDGSGNLYVVDGQSHTIRRIKLATGEVSTFVGTAYQKGATDGVGSAARFNAPHDIVWDGADALYVSEFWGGGVRKVVISTGEVSTLARISARLTGIAWDGAGNLFVGDAPGHLVRKVVAASGQFSTVASGISQPEGIAYDGAGNLYVADYGASVIRKVVVASGQVSTLAGEPSQMGSTDGTGSAARFTNPSGVALDGSGNLYVTELFNTLRKIVVATATVTTIAGAATEGAHVDGIGTAARFDEPFGIVLDGAGNLFLADSNNRTVRKIALSSRTVSTIAGMAFHTGNADGVGSAASFTGLEGVAWDGAGSLFVADGRGATIRRVVIATGEVSTLAGAGYQRGTADGIGTAARFAYPSGLAWDGANLYIVDVDNKTIRKLVVATGVVSTLAGAAGQVGSEDGIGSAARFNIPRGIVCDPAGDLYISDTSNHTIRKLVLATGEVSTVAGTAGTIGNADGTGVAATFYFPWALALDGAGMLYIADHHNATIRKLELATGAVSTVAGTAGQRGAADGIGAAAMFNEPLGLALDGKGTLYVSDSDNATLLLNGFSLFRGGNSTIRKVDVTSGQVSTVAGVAGVQGVAPGPLPGGFNETRGIAFTPLGLAVTDWIENVVMLIH